MGSLKFKGNYKNLEMVSTFVSTAATDAGFSPAEVYKVALAVDEAVTNIIDHAYGGESKGEIEIVCEINGEGITLTLLDEGIPYDPSSVTEPDYSVPIEELTFRGAGLKIIRKVMDEVEYSQGIEGCNTLTLRKRLGN